ncbi:hypothetical protein BpHYR1_006839 [Brachionus plicatilis]|uniref:Uncharacterized protein n=1 Tax=Brachionus plicatilis TaxID=10195 RepID=A0A3M7P978_BRAPC|nr:hypothetical protein BpHYR1_006839 [Brachionus plicatilis]
MYFIEQESARLGQIITFRVGTMLFKPQSNPNLLSLIDCLKLEQSNTEILNKRLSTGESHKRANKYVLFEEKIGDILIDFKEEKRIEKMNVPEFTGIPWKKVDDINMHLHHHHQAIEMHHDGLNFINHASYSPRRCHPNYSNSMFNNLSPPQAAQMDFEYRQELVKQEKKLFQEKLKRFQDKLRKNYPTKFVIAYSSLILSIGVSLIVLQIIYYTSNGVNQNYASGIWAGFIYVVAGSLAAGTIKWPSLIIILADLVLSLYPLLDSICPSFPYFTHASEMLFYVIPTA